MKYFSKIAKFLFLVLILSSCQEKYVDYRYDDIIRISEPLYPLLFDTNSYWIYQNSDSSQLDSISLIGITRHYDGINPSTPGVGPLGFMEYFRVSYSSSIIGVYQEFFYGHFITQRMIFGRCVYIADLDLVADNAEVLDILETMTIQNNKYYSVTKMFILKDKYISHDMYLYYSDSVGVIKKEVLEDDSVSQQWELLRYHVRLFDIHNFYLQQQ